MPFVIDASIAACWVLDDASHPSADAAARRLERDTAIAPSLWWYEMRNLIVTSERRGRLGSGAAKQALGFLTALKVAYDFRCDEDELMRLARTHRLTAYDAAYLELSRRLAAPMATLDAALIRAARAEGAQLIGDEAR